MEVVATALLGDPNPRLSRPPRELRFGSHGSLAVDLRAGTLYGAFVVKGVRSMACSFIGSLDGLCLCAGRR